MFNQSNIGNFSDKIGVKFSSFGAGFKKSQIDKNDTASQSIFNAIDKDKNGIIDQDEFDKFKTDLDNKEADNQITGKEANNFLKNLRKDPNSGIGKEIKKEDLQRFLEQYSLGIQDVKAVEKKGDDVCITYKNGDSDTVHSDKSYIHSGTNPNKPEFKGLTEFDKNGVCTKFTGTDNNGNNVSIEYSSDGIHYDRISMETVSEIPGEEGAEPKVIRKTTTQVFHPGSENIPQQTILTS